MLTASLGCMTTSALIRTAQEAPVPDQEAWAGAGGSACLTVTSDSVAGQEPVSEVTKHSLLLNKLFQHNLFLDHISQGEKPTPCNERVSFILATVSVQLTF